MRLFFCIFYLTFYFASFAQYSISGKITNEENEHLEFAVIFIEGQNLVGSSDQKGNYIIENVKPGQYIVSCSYLGYETKKQLVEINKNEVIDFRMTGSIYQLQSVEISSNSNKITNFPSSNFITKNDLQKENLGQDIPVLLQWQPSIVTTSDAGSGIGYTSLKIRGVDQSRINVTINDIPLNDSESQGVFWVDLPDLASSTENIKIQRGVGPSTNGAGAYGGTVALNTFGIQVNPSIEASTTFGSFNTNKFNVKLNSGLMNNQYNVEARYSNISSDGYVDRAKAKLKSWYIEFSKVNSKTSLRLLSFNGQERTFQAWNGVPEAILKNNNEGLLNHYINNKSTLYNTIADSLNLFNAGRKYNYYLYPQQIDDYNQHHNQLHWARKINNKITAKISLHYTKGRGFFEQFKYKDEFSKYGLPNFVIGNKTFRTGNIVRRRWLNNHFYGSVAKIEYAFSENNLLSIGGGYNQYKGDHFGNVVYTEFDSLTNFGNYYLNNGDKNDGNIYARHETILNKKLSLSLDMQYRQISYKINGIDNNLILIDSENSFQFFNPKAAFNYILNSKSTLSASFAIANREPDRTDFIDNPKNRLPKPERLFDYEIGYDLKIQNLKIQASSYLMKYKDQLIITGELNDVGSNLRMNVPKSYRLGIELMAETSITNKIKWNGNLNISKNKINKFKEVLYDYSDGGFKIVENNYDDVDISLSPKIVAVNNLMFAPIKNLDFHLSTKYIGKQYLDNTNQESRALKAFTFTNLYLIYNPTLKAAKDIKFNLQINNIFNSLYSNNGYTYSYINNNKLITENYLFPQATVNIMVGMSARF